MDLDAFVALVLEAEGVKVPEAEMPGVLTWARYFLESRKLVEDLLSPTDEPALEFRAAQGSSQ